MENNKNISLLKDAPVKKALLKLGIPTMVGMMVSSLYNLVDTYFVGTLGTSQQAAVSAVFPLSLIMLSVGLLFGCGAGSYLARLLGKGNKQKADECASTALVSATICGLVLVIVMLVFVNPILRLLGCTETMMPYAREYAIPFIIGLAVNVFNATLSNLATCEGQPMYSMRSMLIGGITNIILDPVFIMVFHLGVFGAALATLISRLVSMTLYLIYLLGKKSCVHYSVHNIHIETKLLAEIAKIGIPTMIYQLLCSAALSIMNNVAKPFGDEAIAACGIVSRIITLGIMILMGFMKGYQTFVGFNYGAKQYNRVRSATYTELLWSEIFCAICCIGIIIFRIPLIRAFSPNDMLVVQIGSRAMAFNAITFLTVGFQIVYSTKFMGLGRAVDGGLVSLGRQGFFFIPAIYILTNCFGLNGLIISQPVADILSMLLVCVLAVKNNKEENNLLKCEVKTNE